MLILAPQPGRAVAIPNPGDTPIPVSIEAWGGPIAMQSLITEIAIMRGGNYQFTHTLSDLIYVYAFGERISSMRIAGLSFIGGCSSSGGSTVDSPTGESGSVVTGIEKVLAFYDANRISKRRTPVTLAIGTTDAGRFPGFLVGCQTGIARPESRLAQFALEFQTIPRGS